MAKLNDPDGKKDPLRTRALIADTASGCWIILDEVAMAKRWPQFAAMNEQEREELWRKK